MVESGAYLSPLSTNTHIFINWSHRVNNVFIASKDCACLPASLLLLVESCAHQTRALSIKYGHSLIKYGCSRSSLASRGSACPPTRSPRLVGSGDNQTRALSNQTDRTRALIKLPALAKQRSGVNADKSALCTPSRSNTSAFQ